MNASYPIRREVTHGALMEQTFGNLRLIWRELLAYLAVATVLGLGMPLFEDKSTGFIELLFYFAGQYWLFRRLLKRRGMLRTQRIHFLSFFGLALLLILPIMLGLAMLIVPGLFLVARWIAAPAYIVASGEGAFAAASASAAAVRGQTGKVMTAVVVLFLIMIAILTPIAGIDRALGSRAGMELMNVVSGHFLPLLLLGLSVATYERLGCEDTTIEDVFG
ncbi:hypothetical protein [Porphyrobacter sp. AAP60]|uniref:hypothetical protein n=1 Tax=Porphyrobacter sp. AAP60 TaxID=1523423 RepID=UPI0006B8ADBC|nr:hypothetical protein [Porphyrobacter sp. AAP60]KPF64993.1 hypothetical protein IP79_01910 [Porphyrobacter sp. AAP60]